MFLLDRTLPRHVKLECLDTEAPAGTCFVSCMDLCARYLFHMSPLLMVLIVMAPWIRIHQSPCSVSLLGKNTRRRPRSKDAYDSFLRPVNDAIKRTIPTGARNLICCHFSILEHPRLTVWPLVSGVAVCA